MKFGLGTVSETSLASRASLSERLLSAKSISRKAAKLAKKKPAIRASTRPVNQNLTHALPSLTCYRRGESRSLTSTVKRLFRSPAEIAEARPSRLLASDFLPIWRSIHA